MVVQAILETFFAVPGNVQATEIRYSQDYYTKDPVLRYAPSPSPKRARAEDRKDERRCDF